MITASTNTSSRTCHTICLPFEEASYRQIVTDPLAFRAALDQLYRDLLELFPPGFDQGDQFKDCRIVLADGQSYSIRPSFAMP